MAENREYKSDVFSMLMENREYALQVYNALNGSHYDDPELVEIVSLEKGISLSIRNDCAFIVDMSLNIYEHQSSYNPNMPLRALIYFTAYVKNMLKRRDLFSPKMIKIPTPHFAVFYNGTLDRPKRETIRLSMAYEQPTENPELELVCTVYNINPDKDKALLDKCPILDEYMVFVGCVRRFEAEGADNPVEKAIDHCIINHILERFLKENRAEVLKAMTIDMTFERREELIREENQAELEKERKRAEAAEKRVAELEAELTIDMTFERREELIREEVAEEVREEDREKIEYERKRAEAAERRVETAEKRAEAAEKRIAELEALLASNAG